MAHGSIADCIGRIQRVRAALPNVAIMADLPGPKVRSTPFPEGGVVLVEGEAVVVTAAAATPSSSAKRIGVHLDEGVEHLIPGDHLIVGDGGVTMVVTSSGSEVRAEVTCGGRVQGRPGITIPEHPMVAETPTPEDLERITALVAEGVEAIAASFVRSASDVEKIRHAIGNPEILLIAKIETREAVEHIDEIVKAADGVMVARGDLGVRLPIEDVPSLQKQIIRAGVRFGRPVITATQMLESMIHNNVPTRAEVTDVANAVLDGTSAVMLSAETAVGQNPELVVQTMARILRRAEHDFDYIRWGTNLGVQEIDEDRSSTLRITASITAAAWRAALEEDVAAIIACSSSGMTVRSISRFRPSMPIIAVTKTDFRARQLHMSWGVAEVIVHPSEDSYVQTYAAIDHLLNEGLVVPGDVVVVLAGSRDTAVPMTDTVRLLRVQERR
jgi:pyruvate kinase